MNTEELAAEAILSISVEADKLRASGTAETFSTAITEDDGSKMKS